MMNNTKKNEEFDSSGLILFVYRWRKQLLIVVLTAIFGSWFFSLPWFITPKYRSIVILYPASTNSVSKSLVEDHAAKGQDILSFGEDEQAEQLLQILNSSKIRDRVVREFNLMSHYGIDMNSRHKNAKLYREFEKKCHL